MIRRASGEGYKAPNKDVHGQPLGDASRTYTGHHDKKYALYTSEVIDKDLNPSWKAHVLETSWYISNAIIISTWIVILIFTTETLFDSGSGGNFDLDSKFLIDVWDKDVITANDFIGYWEFTLRELLQASISKIPVPLSPPPIPHKQHAGKLVIDVVRPGFPQVLLDTLEPFLNSAYQFFLQRIMKRSFYTLFPIFLKNSCQ